MRSLHRSHRVTTTVLALVGLAGLGTPSARATGQCENLQSTLELVAVSEREDRLVFEGTHSWCAEDDDGLEQRGQLRVAVVTDLEQTLEARFILEPDDAKTRAQLEILGFDEDELAFGRDYEALRERDFIGVEALKDSPRGECRMELEQSPDGEDEYGFPQGTARWMLRSGPEVLLEDELEGIAVEEGSVTITTVFLASSRRLLLWVQVPRCGGGTPPGYFGEDDPGQCYLEPWRELAVLTRAEHPALARCFATGADSSEPERVVDAADAGPPEIAPPSKTRGCQVAPPGPSGPVGALVMLVLGVKSMRRRRSGE